MKVCSVAPEKASMSLMKEPSVEIKMDLPSGLNFKPVHCWSRSPETERGGGMEEGLSV